MDDLIELLATASTAVSSAAGKATGEKMRKQLLVCALDLRNLAIELRRGSAVIPEGAIAVCVKELRETLAAAKSAKSEDGLGRLLAEALEAVETVEQHMVAKEDHALEAAMALTARGMPAGLTPLPPDIFPPRWPRWPKHPRGWPPHIPWPPRPFPPQPWPWPPGPPPWWDMSGWGRDSGG
jgi:hypothetical protein